MERPRHLPREGDVVVLRATVKHDFNDGDDYLFLKIGHHSFSVTLDNPALVGFHSRAWKTGDPVVVPIRGRDYQPGTVVATHRDMVWVDLGGSLETHYSMNLEPDLRFRQRKGEPAEEVVQAPPAPAQWPPEPAPVTGPNEPEQNPEEVKF